MTPIPAMEREQSSASSVGGTSGEKSKESNREKKKPKAAKKPAGDAGQLGLASSMGQHKPVRAGQEITPARLRGRRTLCSSQERLRRRTSPL